MPISLRRVSQSLGLALFALGAWAFLRLAGPVEAEVALIVYALLIAVVVAIFGICFLALRLGTGGSATHWEGNGSRDGVVRIILMIGTTLVLHIGLAAVFDLIFTLGAFSSLILSLVVWTTVPAAFLRFRLVQWPMRLRTAPRLTHLIVVLPAVLLALGVAFNNYSQTDGSTPWVGALPFRIAAVFAAAAAEEVVFRVLLLTALLGFTGSRFQAVFLSGVGFAACHAPLALELPLLRGDWPLLIYAVNAYAPVFALQALLGLVLGVVWLRTGSITAIVAVHVIVNLGLALSSGA